ncbi:hypothetical protein scyTo_0000165 [Scyliorhinus torazame]|uniref:Uncharacterized protein n=1 Tax=Scyliorhinus torazame TaxID=75743 RepID=A0A401NRH6_SCYTO|nr:hypothetical protein [Scyliorhinus torazame]
MRRHVFNRKLCQYANSTCLPKDCCNECARCRDKPGWYAVSKDDPRVGVNIWHVSLQCHLQIYSPILLRPPPGHL